MAFLKGPLKIWFPAEEIILKFHFDFFSPFSAPLIQFSLVFRF
jgi:hypothetical protein